MRILALLSPSFGLHKPIVEELRRQGHDVVLYEDGFLPHDPLNHFGQSYPIRYIFSLFIDSKKNCWAKRITEDVELSKPFDYLFCVNGVSFCDYLYRHLVSKNPRIKCTLYTWDSNRYYHFYKNHYYFDTVYTFDPVDAKKFNVGFLPIYWKRDQSVTTDYKYKVFFIGSYHSDRFEVIGKFVKQLDELNVPYYVKLFVPDNLPKYASLKNILLKLFRTGSYFQTQYKILNMKDRPAFITTSSVSNEEFNKLLQQSEIIFDTEQPLQTGLTGRMMMALGNGKKIITTNTSVKETSLYSPDYICIVDRNNPVINQEFIWSKFDSKEISSDIQKARLDNWVKTLIKE